LFFKIFLMCPIIESEPSIFFKELEPEVLHKSQEPPNTEIYTLKPWTLNLTLRLFEVSTILKKLGKTWYFK
jgi:hypothetical protein